MSEKIYLCRKCGVPMKVQKVDFTYLGHIFHADLPRCPVCGAVFIPRETAEGKMAETEALLEEK